MPGLYRSLRMALQISMASMAMLRKVASEITSSARTTTTATSDAMTTGQDQFR
jgi:hypothetical protein